MVAALADSVADPSRRERVVRASRRAWEVIGPLAPTLHTQVGRRAWIGWREGGVNPTVHLNHYHP